MKKLFLSIIALFAVAALWSRSPLVTEKPTTVFQDTLTMLNVVVCQEDLPYAFNNQLLTDPGTYWDSLTTVNGFDSIVQLNLLVKCCQAATNSPNFADVCGEAPLLCKAYMEATPFDLNNSTADIPGNLAAQFCYPVDHSRWLRFSACASTVSLELSVQNCSGTDPLQNGVEIALFTSPDCLNFTRLGSCYQTAVLDTQILQFDGLIPGNEYYLLADGIGANICSFRLKALSGVNSGMPDSYNTVGAEADGAIVGDNDVCAGETATYTIIPPSCKLTFPVFSCSPPEGACGFCGTVLTLDSIIYKWHIPECARFLGDSTGLDVTIIYDQCIFDTDTVVTQTIWAEVIPIYSDTSFVQKDTLIFCDCFGGGLSCGNIPPLDIKIHYNVEHIFLIIPCVGPPPEFMGTIYPAPGLFIKFDALNCILYKIHVEKELDPSISISFGGTITCVYFPTLQAISADPITWQTPFGSMGNSPTIVAYEPGVYTAVATSAGGCLSAASTVVNLDVQPPFTYLGPDLFVCSEELPVQLTAIGSWGFNLYNWSTGATGQSITDFQSGGIFTYAVTITNPQNGCTDSDNITVTYNSPLYTSLSPVVLCPGECFMLGGETFCPVAGDPPAQVTLTSYTGCDSIVTRPFIFQSPPPTMLSPIGLCPGECFTFNGQMICPSAGDTPPSMLLSTANGCDSMVVQPFVFNAPDTTQLGVMATLTCAVTSAVVHGITYSQPGVYAVQVDPCTVEKFIIAQNIQSPPPTILSPIGLCPGECFTFNGQMICPSQGDVPPNMFLSAANGCDSMVIQPFVFNAPDTTQLGLMATLTCAVTSAVINGTTYSQPGVYAVQVDPCTVEKFIIAQNIQSPPPTMLSPIGLCPGECFTFNGQMVCPSSGDTPPGMLLPAANGCDSMVIQPFVFNAPDTTQLGVMATLTCAVTSAVVNGTTYSQPGVYTVQIDPCTVEQFSIAQNIQLPPPTMLSPIGLCPGECFTFNGQMICPSQGDAPPNMLLSAANGCDSMVIQPFVLNAPDTTQLGVMATLTCAVTSAVVNGTTYSQPGVYTVQVDPCTVEQFSIAQNIQSPPPTMLSPIGLCPGECFTFNGQMVCPSQGDAPPNLLLSATNGCDSMVIQPFVFNAPDTTQLGVMATLTCAVTSTVVNGTTYSQPGVYTVQIDPCTVEQFSIAQNIQLPPPTMLSPIGLCPGECFTFNGQMICPSQGDAPPNMLLSAANGCDSMVIQPFVLNAPDTTQLGVMATLTCAVTSAVINGTTYSQPGVYAVQVNPCTVEQFSIAQDIQSPPPTMLSPIGLCPGECFTFNGQMICPSSGDTPPGMLLPASNGCDSMVIQPFVFNAPDTTQLGVMATLTCAVTSAVVNGTTYSQPGVYTVQIDPCTVEQFSIAQNIQSPPPTMLSPIGLCPGECFTFNGQMICPSQGDAPPNMLLSAANGCDSMVIQPFVLNAPDTTQLGVMATLTCAVTSAVINGTTYSQPGVYAVQVDPCTVEQFSIEQTTAPALTMLPIVHICPGDCIEFDGLSFCPQPGDPPLQKLLQTTGGCDSLIQQPFALNVPDTLSMGTLAMLSCVDTSVVLAGITYTQAGEYVLQKDPCTYERFAIAENPEKCLNVYVPNIIQADSENANSWFTLYTNVDSGIEINYLRIFDRWGNQVFLSTHFPPNAPQSGWNGLFNGKPCLPGVYVFMYELQLPDGVRQVKTGDLTLIR